VTSFRNRAPQYFALAGTLGLALALAGCGVKGGLEPPPSATIPAGQTAEAAKPAEKNPGPNSIGAPSSMPSATSMLGQPPAAAGVARGTTSAAVTQAPAAQRSSPLDWLIR
jgi:predicted small lipoprotein YifL